MRRILSFVYQATARGYPTFTILHYHMVAKVDGGLLVYEVAVASKVKGNDHLMLPRIIFTIPRPLLMKVGGGKRETNRESRTANDERPFNSQVHRLQIHLHD